MDILIKMKNRCIICFFLLHSSAEYISAVLRMCDVSVCVCVATTMMLLLMLTNSARFIHLRRRRWNNRSIANYTRSFSTAEYPHTHKKEARNHCCLSVVEQKKRKPNEYVIRAAQIGHIKKTLNLECRNHGTKKS